MGEQFETNTEIVYTMLKQELHITPGCNHISKFRKDKDDMEAFKAIKIY